MELSPEQQKAFHKYIQGKNVFITGPGGTGKSELVRRMFKESRSIRKKVQVCALTGCAAILLQCKSKTLHSWAGIGLANEPIDQIVKKIKNNKYRNKPWKQTDILIVDEVSMMSIKIFKLLDLIGRTVREKPHLPFGGIQVVFLGDFYQLPPIGNREEPETLQFCFESAELWNTVFPVEDQVILETIFRQKDPVYAKILNEIRECRMSKKNNNILLSRVGVAVPDDLLVKPTKLFPRIAQVYKVNQEELAKLDLAEEKQFTIKRVFDLPMTKEEKEKRASYSPEDLEAEFRYLIMNLLCEQMLSLRVGSQVMCVVNMETASGDKLCNGSQGIITRMNDLGHPVVKYNSGVEVAMGYHNWASENIPGIGISQIPLILAWAITIHKSQGSTLEHAEIDVGSGIFECGQTYVALSRVKSLEGLYLTSYDLTKIKINRFVKQFYEDLKKKQAGMIVDEDNTTIIPSFDLSRFTNV
jgi:ATP-dependent DNA helicase PIF1